MSPPGHPVHHFTDRGHSQPPHLVSEIVRVRLARLGVGLISPDRGRLPTDRRPTRRRKDSAVDVPLGCPLPAVLPAVSRSVRRFLTRSDPQSPSVFPTNAGFLGDFAESGTGSQPGTRGTSSRSSARSTGDSTSAGANTPQDPRDRNRASPIVLVQPRRPRTARTTRSDWTSRSRTRTCRPWTPPDATVYAVELRAC